MTGILAGGLFIAGAVTGGGAFVIAGVGILGIAGVLTIVAFVDGIVESGKARGVSCHKKYLVNHV